jgi:AAA15 family ATPase/GTPase
MLKKIILEQYRCFAKTEISFKETTIIVGKNNAGKSTLIESLRILAVVVNRAKSLNFKKPPSWLNLPEVILGIQPSITNLDISTRNIFYMYGDGPAKITADFNNNVKFVIYIGEDGEVFATIYAPNGLPVESKKFASRLQLDEINILPQITPLLKLEQIIKIETVQKNILTNLSSRNFRNQLNYFSDEFQAFKELSERTWKGLYIHSDQNNIRTQGNLFLFVRDNKFEAEIGWMGHGLQMWLQTMWFLSRSSKHSTIILDEPDVYMHADLQRRLVKLVKQNYSQVIIATHSVEIMSEVEPGNIMPINNEKPKQDYANKAPIVQKILNDIGSVHNIEIARLFSYNKFLIIEGEKDDIKLLTAFQSKLFPDTFEHFDILPKIFVEGWGGWQRVIGSNKVFKENKSSLSIYCIFDSDYHLENEKRDRYIDAVNEGINLHIWERKEIENYLLIPSVFCRLIKQRKKNAQVEEEQIANQIDNICESLKQEVIDAYANEMHTKDKSKAISTINQMAREYVNTRWEMDKYKLVSGKKVTASICKWVSDNFKVSINKFAIASEILRLEMPEELTDLINKIENRIDFTYSKF